MSKGKYTVLGTKVDDPPQDGTNVAPRQPLLQSNKQPFKTQPVFATAGLNYQSPTATQTDSPILNHITNDGFSYSNGVNCWMASQACSLVMEIYVDAHVDGATLSLNYYMVDGGSDEGTAIGITVTSGAGADAKSTGTAWKANTDQPDWGTATSPPFDLFRGTNRITLTIYVAEDNTLVLSGLEINPPPFTQQDMTINFYWKCIRDETVIPGGYFTMTDTYSTGVSKESSSTSEVSQTMGLSASAGYKSISVGINKSIASKQSNLEQVSFTETHETKDEHNYPNGTKDQNMQLQLWQPCVEYLIGAQKIVDEQEGNIQVTMQYSKVDSGAAAVMEKD